MKIEKKKIKDLIPAFYNPRRSTPKQEKNLAESLKKFGVVEPIIWNKQTKNIVGGHFRVRELEKLGFAEVDCVVIDLSLDDEKELNIRLNANTGEWDWLALDEQFDFKQLESWGLEFPEIVKEEMPPELESGEKQEFRQVTFTLHDAQYEIVEMALKKAKEVMEDATINDNANGNALFTIAEGFINGQS